MLQVERDVWVRWPNKDNFIFQSFECVLTAGWTTLQTRAFKNSNNFSYKCRVKTWHSDGRDRRSCWHLCREHTSHPGRTITRHFNRLGFFSVNVHMVRTITKSNVDPGDTLRLSTHSHIYGLELPPFTRVKSNSKLFPPSIGPKCPFQIAPPTMFSNSKIWAVCFAVVVAELHISLSQS